MSLVNKLKEMSATELEEYAAENNIDLFGTSNVAEMLETILNFVPIEEFPLKLEEVEKSAEEDKKPQNVIDARIYPEEVKKEPKEKKAKKTDANEVALYAIRNLHWSSVGSLEAGYNIVSKEESEKWLTHRAVRLASPEEVATYFGK